MSVDSHVERALDRAKREREAADAKIEAYETFRSRVEDLPAESPPAPGSRVTAAVGALAGADGAPSDRCRTVREAFAETVRPHSVADVDEAESVGSTLRSELTDPIAVALAPTSEARFTEDLKRAIVSEIRSRRRETAVMRRAVSREIGELEATAAVIGEIGTWIDATDETPLTECGFDALRDRHETLADHRRRCETLVEERQAFLRDSTCRHDVADVSHRRLATFLYQDFPVDHPVLATVAALDEACRECQRRVREHLVRRA